MKILSLVFATLIILSSHAFAKGSGALLVAGDSWTDFMCLEESFPLVFFEHGYSVETSGCDGANKFGARAEIWNSYPASAKTFQHLRNKPDIKAVYLSIGGNDFFNHWRVGMTPAEEQVVFENIKGFIQKMVSDILRLRPDVKVLVSGYDYGNFKDYSKILKFYTELYDNLGKPSTAEVDHAVLRLSSVLATLADGQHVFYIQHYGLAHYYYGNREYNLKAHTTPAPDLISPPSNPTAYGGVPEYEVSLRSLLSILFLHDAYHPNPKEFFHIADHAFQHYLKEWFE